MAKLPRRDAIRGLYATLKDAPPNLAALSIGADGSVRAEFREPRSAPPSETAAPPPKLVEGTPFPDDGSPINAADLSLNPIDLSERN